MSVILLAAQKNELHPENYDISIEVIDAKVLEKDMFIAIVDEHAKKFIQNYPKNIPHEIEILLQDISVAADIAYSNKNKTQDEMKKIKVILKTTRKMIMRSLYG